MFLYYKHCNRNCKIKTTKETCDNNQLGPLNIFCCDKLLTSLNNWEHNNSLKQFSGMNKWFGVAISMSSSFQVFKVS